MEDLTFINREGQVIVAAKELCLRLGLKETQWSKWYKKNIQQNETFAEGEDWVEAEPDVWIGAERDIEGNKTMAFAVSLTFAKHITMMVKTEKSHQYRNYFIECEKQLKVASCEVQKLLGLGEEDRAILYFQQVKKKKLLDLKYPDLFK